MGADNLLLAIALRLWMLRHHIQDKHPERS